MTSNETMSPSSNYDSDLSNNNVRINSAHNYKYLLTNARSLSPKIESLHTAFSEHELDFALITESWLKDGQVLDKDVIDLEWGTNLKIIYKNRPKNAAGLRKVGGGVSIVYNKSRCNFRERKIRGNKFELVMAVGRVGTVPRQVAVFCVYIEPRMKVAELASLCDTLSREILMLKAKGDPIIIVGGDMNRKSLDDALADFPDVKQINSAPTRGDACLDLIYSNGSNLNPSTWPPLETREGVRSDHLCVIVSGQVERERNFEWIRTTTRKHTDAAVVEYGRRLRQADWSTILGPEMSTDEMVEAFQAWTSRLTDELFPMKTARRRSNEDPWITDAIRRVSKQKCRVYKRQGKSRHWRILDHRIQQMTMFAKRDYVDRFAQSGTSTRSFFTAVKKLGSAANNEEWNLTSLFPGSTGLEAGEKAAEYFTRITDLFEPLQHVEASEDEMRRPITEEEVRKRLKEAKKPNSTVEGDILPRVVKAHNDALAVPVTRIFNSVFRHSSWPVAWKTETTVIIPKVSNPESLADCRNLSCTPFLSKVLESIVLEDMRSEIPEDLDQYGGTKASSVDHLLVDLFEGVTRPLEDGQPSLVLGIDFEKAFNRLDHDKCLSQLKRLGASKSSIALTRSFLTGRMMRVKVGSQLSNKRPLKGGSPQGSIMGCYLYCAATRKLDLSLPPPSADAASSPRPNGATEDEGPVATSPPEHSSGSSEDSPGGFGILRAFAGDDSASTGSFHTASEVSSISTSSGEEGGPIMLIFKYVDDTTITINMPADSGIRHISAAAPEEEIPANDLRSFFLSLIEAAEDMGMAVNCKKTQLLCFSPDNGYNTTASFMVNGESVSCQETMKLLGYMLGTAPGATDQVGLIKAKFRARFWSLIHLRRAGISGDRLFKLYAALVRPILETNCVIFHPMLTRTQDEEIERLQKQVVRLCYGHDESYAEACRIHQLERLGTRRETRIRRFTSKAMNNPRFASRWFRRRPEIETDIRNRRPIIENKAKTERYKKSPLVNLQRNANDLLTNVAR